MLDHRERASISSEVEAKEGWVAPVDPERLRNLIKQGCAATYSELFGQDWYSSLADHHREALDWHFEARLAFLEGRKPEHLAYFPVWSRGHAKSSLAERMIVVDAVLSVAFDQPGFALYIGREKDKIKEHIGNIEQILSSERVMFYAPSLSQVARNEETNQKRQWTGTFLHTQGKYVVKGGSIESAQAGSRVNETRPTVIVPDDIDGREDSPVISQMRMNRLTKEILPMRQQNTLVFFAQNLISRYSVMYQIQSQQVQVLTNRKATKPIPAVIDLVTEQVTGEDGLIRDVYVSGKSTWPQVWDIDRINDEIQTEGLEAFEIECQHNVEARKEGLFHKNYNDSVHAISYSQFDSVYGIDAWKDWFKIVANDWARTKTKYHANVAAYLAVSSADTVLPGITFLIPFSFEADTAPADVAERLLSALTPYAYGENGNRATWRQLIDEAWKRMNAEQHFETVADRWAFEKDYYKRIIPKYSKKVLQAYQVRAGVMSHSEDKVREMFNAGFGFGFRPSNPGKTEGLESIDAAMKIDHSLEHPFPKFDENGRVKGYSRFFVLCPDDKAKEPIFINGVEVYPPVPYPETLKVDSLHNSDLFRYQMRNRRFLPPKLMETGERIDEPEKLHDDFGQLLQMVYITNLLKNIKLGPGQQVQALISSSVKEAVKTATTAGEKVVTTMAYEFEKELAEERLGVREVQYEDEWI